MIDANEVSGELVQADPHNPDHLRAVVRLHRETLPGSQIVGLGDLFCRRFFYPVMLEYGLIRCELYAIEGQYVGFVTYTLDPFGFIRSAIKRHPFKLMTILSLSVLADPRRLGILGSFVLTSKPWDAGFESEREKIGEMLSFGVDPRYRGKLDRASGKKISRLLFDGGLRYLLLNGKKHALLRIQKRNAQALAFYHYLSGPLEDWDKGHVRMMVDLPGSFGSNVTITPDHE